MESESDGDINTLGTVIKGLAQGLGDMEIRGQGETIQTTAFFKVGLNTEKSHGDI